MDEVTGTIDWRRPACWAVLVLSLAGCDTLGTTTKHKNPVVPAPPRWRMQPGESETSDAPAQSAIEGGASRAGPSGTARTSVGAQPTTARAAARDQRSPARPKAVDTDDDDGSAEDGQDIAQAADVPEGARWKTVAQTSASRSAGGSSPRRPGRPRAPAADQEAAEAEPSAQDRTIDEEDPTALKLGLETEGAGEPVEKGEVAATVNGVPIFVDEVLFGFAQALEEGKKRMPPEEFRKQRAALIRRYAPMLVERELLLQALKLRLKEENLNGLIKHIDGQYKEELVSTMKRLGVSTQGELEMKLRKQGQSIEFLKVKFRNQQLAQQYLSSRAVPRTGFDLPDLHEYYQEHRGKYAIPARVKWQQIHLIYENHGGKEATVELAEQLMQRLQDGEDFAPLARELSDGPTKDSGGYWPWTNANSMKSKVLDEALFTMPIGEQFAMIEGIDAVDIVVVLARNDAGFKSFVSVQDEIKLELKQAEFQRAAKEVLAELRSKATIEMFVDPS